MPPATVETRPLIALIGAALAYALLVTAAVRRGQPFPTSRVLAFASGLAVIAVALFSALDPYGEEHSLAAHMLQHELLLMVAPILLVLGLDQTVTMPLGRAVFGPATRSRPWRAVLALLGNPYAVTATWCLMVAGWHLPAMYDLALDNDTVHVVEHSCLLTVGVAFWVVVVGRLPSLHRTTTAQRLGALACAMVVSSGLGAVLWWSPQVLYSRYADARPWFGFTPLADQRFAGALMMAVDMPLLLGAGIFVAARWARREARLGSTAAAPGGPDRPLLDRRVAKAE